jgi:hypothetical protein
VIAQEGDLDNKEINHKQTLTQIWTTRKTSTRKPSHRSGQQGDHPQENPHTDLDSKEIIHKKTLTQIWTQGDHPQENPHTDLDRPSQVGQQSSLSTSLIANPLHRNLVSTLRNPHRGLNTPRDS